MTVIDASALFEYLLRHPIAAQVRPALESGAMAPDLIDAEVLHSLVRFQKHGTLSALRTQQALNDLFSAPIVRIPSRSLLIDGWRRSAALSGYDALYVALAEMTRSTLMTADARLANSPGLSVPVTLVPQG